MSKKPDLDYLKKFAPKAYAKAMKPILEKRRKLAKEKSDARVSRIRKLMAEEIVLDKWKD